MTKKEFDKEMRNSVGKLFDLIYKTNQSNVKMTDEEILNKGIEKGFIKGLIVGYLKGSQKEKTLEYVNNKLYWKNIRIFQNTGEFLEQFMNACLTDADFILPNKCSAFDFISPKINMVSDEKMNNILYKYTKIKTDDQSYWIDNPKYKWECICRENSNDTKYGRQMVDHNLKLIRSITMGEFYGGGIVD